MLGVIDFTLSLPFRMLAGAGGASVAILIALPTINDSKSRERSRVEVIQSLHREAKFTFSDVKAWLPGLTVEQVSRLTCTGSAGVFLHLRGKEHVAGVPRVQPLPAHVLAFESKPAD